MAFKIYTNFKITVVRENYPEVRYFGCNFLLFCLLLFYLLQICFIRASLTNLVRQPAEVITYVMVPKESGGNKYRNCDVLFLLLAV